MRPARAILYLRRFPMPEAAKKLKRKSEARIRLLSQPPLDWPLAIIVLTLVVFGLVMLFSASYATAITASRATASTSSASRRCSPRWAWS